MIKPINIKDKLVALRNKQLKKTSIIDWAHEIFDEIEVNRERTLLKLKSSKKLNVNKFNFDKLESRNIFHISQIKEICIDYRLRFLNTVYFKGDYPEEAILKIHQLQKDHDIDIDGFMIMAPSILFKLKKADDPLLLAPIGNNYFYLIHQWGNDLHPFRKIKYWAMKNIENLAISILILSLISTFISKSIFYDEFNFGYALVILFSFLKAYISFSVYAIVATGKNFSNYAWRSKFDKLS